MARVYSTSLIGGEGLGGLTGTVKEWLPAGSGDSDDIQIARDIEAYVYGTEGDFYNFGIWTVGSEQPLWLLSGVLPASGYASLRWHGRIVLQWFTGFGASYWGYNLGDTVTMNVLISGYVLTP